MAAKAEEGGQCQCAAVERPSHSPSPATNDQSRMIAFRVLAATTSSVSFAGGGTLGAPATCSPTV